MLKDGLVNEEEEESLKETDVILSNILNTQYSRNISLSAYPAFLAIGNCCNRDEISKRKFLELLSVQNILLYSNIEKFKNWLTESFVTDTKDKIIKANHKKVYTVIDETIKEIKEQNEILNIMREALIRNTENTKINLDSVLIRIKNKFRTESDYSLDEFEQNFRASIYKEIEKYIDNKELKKFSESKYEEFIETLSSNLQKRFEGLNEGFGTEVKNTLEKHNKIMEELIKIYNTRYSIDKKINFSLNLKSSINKTGLIFSIESIITGIIMAISNPAGWVGIALVAFKIGYVIYKIIRENFDNDYRAGKQREATNQQIAKIKVLIKKDIEEKLLEIDKNLNVVIEELRESLSDENKKIDNIIDIFENVKNKFCELSLIVKRRIARGGNYGNIKDI